MSQESQEVNLRERNPFDALFHAYENRWRANGWVRDIQAQYRIERDSTDLVIRLHDGRGLFYSLTAHEIVMGGMDAARHWFEHVERDIRQQALGEYGLANQLGNYTAQQQLGYQQLQQYNTLVQQQMAAQTAILMQNTLNQAQTRVMFGWDLAQPGFTDEADKKARELFKKTVGEKEYEILDKGNPLPITGSKGTAYNLFAKASFCIERIKDKARLCAVVPGVPLWDHLLGIKLMVEHDEPTFLKTANVSGGQRESRWNRFREMFA